MIGFSKFQQTGKKTASTDLASINKKRAQIEAKTACRKKRTPLKLMSKKAKAELRVWNKVKGERIKLLEEKFGGYAPCELCKVVTTGQAEGHHNDHDRRNNELENCRILHRVCNQRVEDENIKDVPSLL